MAADLCARARVEISARLDGEAHDGALDAHLDECASCRAHQRQLQAVRRRLRLQTVPPVPDLTGAVMERVRGEGMRGRRRAVRAAYLRTAGVAAAAAALVLAGAILPVRRPADVASATEIRRAVRAAVTALTRYRANFEILERGWHPRAATRRFTAEVFFESPERFRLSVRDHTPYPSGDWPANDIDVIASPQRFWMREPATCPVAAVPHCGATPIEHGVARRRPFDPTGSLPTDIIIPLETLASSGSFDVLGATTVKGRAAFEVALQFRQAAALVGALQSGGSWRPFHPLDRVVLWVDRKTWFPLRFEVVAGNSPDRAEWAATHGLFADRSGRVLLSARATSFATPERFAEELFRSPRVRGADSGFRSGRFDAVAAMGAPAFTGGLEPYRAGWAPGGRRVLSYERGLRWLKITHTAGRAPAYPSTAEEVAVAGGWAYYLPAAADGRRTLEVFGRHSYIHLESNLPRAALLRVAASLPGQHRRAPTTIGRPGHSPVRRVSESEVSRLGFARPGYLPAEHRFAAALVSGSSGSQRVTVYYRAPEAEFDQMGIRVTHDEAISLLPPSSERLVGVAVSGRRGRWSPERGELEWMDAGAYRAVAAPSFDLATALQIAQSLR